MSYKTNYNKLHTRINITEAVSNCTLKSSSLSHVINNNDYIFYSKKLKYKDTSLEGTIMGNIFNNGNYMSYNNPNYYKVDWEYKKKENNISLFTTL